MIDSSSHVLHENAETDGTPAVAPDCTHHWVIEPPLGLTSIGTCKRCGRIREFANSGGGPRWEREPAVPAEVARAIRAASRAFA